MKHIQYILAGLAFGFVLTKTEAISWFRIQEMFYFKSFHMFGLIGSAVVTGLISLQLMKRFNVQSVKGQQINVAPKKFNAGTIIGGLIFGLGWGITGACPGPLFAQLGYGYFAVFISIIGALTGTFIYGIAKSKLP